jgi:hypothetical protein
MAVPGRIWPFYADRIDMQGSCPYCCPAGPGPVGLLLTLATLWESDGVSMKTHDACRELREKDFVNSLGIIK